LVIKGSTCVLPNISSGRSYSGNNVAIENCIFVRTNVFSGNGGVIYISGSWFLSSYNCVYYYCSCTKYGGAIYFWSSSFDLLNNCAFRCFSPKSFHFAYLVGYNDNKVRYISISSCSDTSIGDRPIQVDQGNSVISNTNSSLNCAVITSGFSIAFCANFQCSYCTLSNNNVSDYVMFLLYHTKGHVSFCNILHNNSPLKYGVIYYVSGTYNLDYTIINNNMNILFYGDKGTLQLSHSYIFHAEPFSNDILLTNNSITQYPSYLVSFFATLFCSTDFPSMTPARTYIEFCFSLAIIHQNPKKTCLFPIFLSLVLINQE